MNTRTIHKGKWSGVKLPRHPYSHDAKGEGVDTSLVIVATYGEVAIIEDTELHKREEWCRCDSKPPHHCLKIDNNWYEFLSTIQGGML